MSEPHETKKVIYLTLLNGTGYIFDVNDYMQIRTKCRIMGALVGTANTKGWCSNEATLPVELSTNETQLLLDEGKAILLSKINSLTEEPTPQQQRTYKEGFEKRLAAQSDELKAEKLRETHKHLDKILAGKRNKLLTQGEAEQADALTANDVLQEMANNFKFERRNALVEMPCAHLEKHYAKVCKWSRIDNIKYRVFRDLWRRGKFVTCGDAFGADFLVYPGDPLLYHASHVVIIVTEPDRARPLGLIAKVRLSVNVNKNFVFAYEENDGKIVYQTIAWRNPNSLKSTS